MTVSKTSEWTLPLPGQRIVRSVCAVGLCFVVFYLRNQQGIPFYSALAALQCMQPYQESTVAVGKKRTKGTLIGAFWGLTVILIELHTCGGRLYGNAAGYMLIACFTGVVLYSTVLLKMTDTAYFSCVVFLSIAVMHMKDAEPFLFVADRVIDTMIGIVLALLVNSVHLPRKKNTDILYVSGLDDTILDGREQLTAYNRVELNRLIGQGANFTVSTLRTPADVRKVMEGVHLKLPIIAMDGAVLYDMKENAYLMSYKMDAVQTARVRETLERMDVYFFANVLVDDMLVIYYNGLSNEAQEDIYNKMHSSPYRNYVKRTMPDEERAVYFMMIEKRERAENIYREFTQKEGSASYKVLLYDSNDYPGYAYVKIYSREATRENMLGNLQALMGMKKTVTFGSVEEKYDVYIKNSDKNEMVRQLKKQFEPVLWEKNLSFRRKRGFLRLPFVK